MSYNKPYLRATSLADELVGVATDPELQQQKTRQRISAAPEISTGLMSSTRRAFQEAADSFKVSGGYVTEEPYQEDPMDMLASYIAGLDDPEISSELQAALDKAREEKADTTAVPEVDFGSIKAGTTTFDFDLSGKDRPNMPKYMDTLTDLIDKAATATFGEGSRVVVFSGQGEYGSTRHRGGHAADIKVYRPDGSKVNLEDDDARVFLTNASRAGILGIGAGSEYMGLDRFHLDIYPYEKYSPKQGPRWGSFGSTVPNYQK